MDLELLSVACVLLARSAVHYENDNSLVSTRYFRILFCDNGSIIRVFVVKNEMIVHYRIWLVFDFMWIFVNLYPPPRSIFRDIRYLTPTFRLASIVLSLMRLLFAVVTGVIYAIRMDAPLLREEFDRFDYGNNPSIDYLF